MISPVTPAPQNTSPSTCIRQAHGVYNKNFLRRRLTKLSQKVWPEKRQRATGITRPRHTKRYKPQMFFELYFGLKYCSPPALTTAPGSINPSGKLVTLTLKENSLSSRYFFFAAVCCRLPRSPLLFVRETPQKQTQQKHKQTPHHHHHQLLCRLQPHNRTMLEADGRLRKSATGGSNNGLGLIHSVVFPPPNPPRRVHPPPPPKAATASFTRPALPVL